MLDTILMSDDSYYVILRGYVLMFDNVFMLDNVLMFDWL